MPGLKSARLQARENGNGCGRSITSVRVLRDQAGRTMTEHARRVWDEFTGNAAQVSLAASEARSKPLKQ